MTGEETGDKLQDRSLVELVDIGQEYCEHIDRILSGIDQLPPHMAVESQERRRVVDTCRAISEYDFQGTEVYPEHFGVSAQEVVDGIGVLERMKAYRAGGLEQYLDSLEYRERWLVNSYIDYFLPDAFEAKVTPNRVAFCIYLMKTLETQAVEAYQDLEGVIGDKRETYAKQNLATPILDMVQDTEIYVCSGMFDPFRSWDAFGHNSIYPASAVVYFIAGSPKHYGSTVVHERMHGLLSEVHSFGDEEEIARLVRTEPDAVRGHLNNRFKFEEVLADLLTYIEDPNISDSGYYRGVRHLAHILEATSIERYGETGKNNWKNHCLGLITTPGKTDIYKSIQQWYDAAIPDEYGSFVEEMLVYCDKSILSNPEECATYEEACEKWGWIKYGLSYGVDPGLLKGIYEKLRSKSVSRGDACLLDMDNRSIRTVLA